MIVGLVDDAVASGARRERACRQLGLTARCVQRWGRTDVGDDVRAGPHTRPANALTLAERAKVLAVVNSPEYRDLPPKQIVPRLADEGRYVASESTVNRKRALDRSRQTQAESSVQTMRWRADSFWDDD